jgi:hypothetical protein
MAGTIGQSDDPAALARLLVDLQRRLTRLETQNRLRDATIDEPGLLRYRDATGVVRFALGTFENGGIGVRQYGPDGSVLAAAEQASGVDPQTVDSTDYGDAGTPLTVTATAGPSGQMLVVLSSLIQATDPTIVGTGFMSFVTTGGRVTAAQDINSLEWSAALVDAETEPAGAQGDHTHGLVGEAAAGGETSHTHLMYTGSQPVRPFRASRTVLLSGCDPTLPVVITAKYRVSNAAGSYVFDDRSLIVVPL